MPLPVYLDVDTGIDDALAILLAVRHPALEVRGITTVVGNVDLMQVTRNTLQVLELAGAPEIPVAAGAERPLVAEPRPADFVHGPDGLGGANLPPPRRTPVAESAITFLRRELLAAAEPVTLITLAPLTNIALLLREAPEVKRKIRRIVMMGGAVGSGNATPVAEFNIFHDPEAAEIVFGSGLPILMYGLEVFHEVNFAAEEVDRWFGVENLAASGGIQTPRDLAAHLLHFNLRTFGSPTATIGDAGCVAAVVDPQGLVTQQYPVYIETGGRYCRGQTVVDRRDPHLPDPRFPYPGALVDVALRVDAPFYKQLFREALEVGV